MKGNRREDKAVKPRRAVLTSHRPRGRRGARSIWFGVSSTNKSKRQWQEALESSNSCFGFSWNNSTYVMWPADNNAQPGTCKNARRMCLRHQTIQYFCFIGTEIEKGKKKKKEKKASLEFLDFLDRVSVERRAAKRGGHGPCRAQPRGIGAQRHPRCVPAAAASARGSPGMRGGTASTGLCDGWGGICIHHPAQIPSKGAAAGPSPLRPLRGERSCAQKCCVSSENDPRGRGWPGPAG